MIFASLFLFSNDTKLMQKIFLHYYVTNFKIIKTIQERGAKSFLFQGYFFLNLPKFKLMYFRNNIPDLHTMLDLSEEKSAKKFQSSSLMKNILNWSWADRSYPGKNITRVTLLIKRFKNLTYIVYSNIYYFF